jgi:hypothetical protein
MAIERTESVYVRVFDERGTISWIRTACAACRASSSAFEPAVTACRSTLCHSYKRSSTRVGDTVKTSLIRVVLRIETSNGEVVCDWSDAESLASLLNPATPARTVREVVLFALQGLDQVQERSDEGKR